MSALAVITVVLTGLLLLAVGYHTGSLAAERRQARTMRLDLARRRAPGPEDIFGP